MQMIGGLDVVLFHGPLTLQVPGIDMVRDVPFSRARTWGDQVEELKPFFRRNISDRMAHDMQGVLRVFHLTAR